MKTNSLFLDTEFAKIQLSANASFIPEVVHYYGDNLLVASRHRVVTILRPNGSVVISFPKTKFDFLGFSRLMRRAFRLDKCNVFPLDALGQEFLMIRGGIVYKYDHQQGLQIKLKLTLARNILHTDLCVMRSGRILFGEYGANQSRTSIPIYASDDKGRSWHVAYQIPAGKAKHVHGVYADKYTDQVWIFTGDENGECWVIQADENFSQVEYIGDGSQTFRACTVFFTKESVVWAMDSPLEPSKVVHLHRQSGAVERHFSFPGPVWYGREVASEGYVLASTVEPGASVVDDKAAIYFSEDLITWSRVAEFRKDIWPINVFKFGVVGFSRGDRPDGAFYIFGEALEGLDGKSIRCKIIR